MILILFQVFSLTTAMQYLKTQKSQPLSQLWHIKTQRCGLRHTVYSASGDEYTGEWLDNKKHGKMECSSLQSLLRHMFMLVDHDSGYCPHAKLKCLVIHLIKEKELKFGRRMVPFMMGTGNLENVTDMATTAFYSQKPMSTQDCTVVDGKMA